MRLFDGARELAFESFAFPDGQRHFKLLDEPRGVVDVSARIRTGDELLDVLLAAETLKGDVNLRVTYLLGGRMDRRISNLEPFTLRLVAQLLMNTSPAFPRFREVTVLDPHSAETVSQLSGHGRLNARVEAVLPRGEFQTTLLGYDQRDTVLVAPDRGAVRRVVQLATGTGFSTAFAGKDRDPATGKLSNFKLLDPKPVAGKRCLVVDDICDGGGTFSGLSEVLRDAGAATVDLFVTHGIFSRGLPVPGVDVIHTTDSYRFMEAKPGLDVFKLGARWWKPRLTVVD